MSTVATLSAPQSVLTGVHQNPDYHQTINAESPHEFIVSASSHSDAGCSFNQNLSSNVLLERCAHIEYEVTVDYGFRDDLAALASASTATTNGIQDIFLSDNAAGDEENASIVLDNNGDPNIALPFLEDMDVCLAQFPIHRICSSLQVTLNNTSLTSNPNIYLNALAKYMLNEKNIAYYSHCPASPDPAANPLRFSKFFVTDGPMNSVVQATNQAKSGDNTESDSHKNQLTGLQYAMKELGNCGDRSDAQIKAVYIKTGYAADLNGSLSRNFATTFSDKKLMRVVYKVTEPLMHQFFMGPESRDTFANISQLDVKFVFQANLHPLLVQGLTKIPAATWSDSRAADAVCYNRLTLEPMIKSINLFKNATSVDGTLGDVKPRLLLRTYVPVVQIPPTVKMPYYDIVPRVYKIDGNVEPSEIGKSYAFETDSIVLSSVPHRIYIFARPTNQYGTTESNNTTIATGKKKLQGMEADQFLCIDQLTMLTDLNSGLLTQAEPQQLYQMCKRNGSNQSYQGFRKNQGSVVCLDLSNSDCGAWIAGARTQFQFRLKGSFNADSLKNYYHLVQSGAASGSNVTQSSMGKRDGLNANIFATVGGEDISIPFSLHVIAVQQGQMTADLSSMVTSTGINASAAQAVAAAGPTAGVAEETEAGGGVALGGGARIGGALPHHKIGKLAKSAGHHIKQGAKAAMGGMSQAAGATQSVLDKARSGM